MKAAILGVTGYTGLILLRILGEHPDIESIIPVSSSKVGKGLPSIDPGLPSSIAGKARDTSGLVVSIEDAAALKPDVVFSALPHLTSADSCQPFFGSSVVIDLSADLRIADPALFREAYGEEPPRPDLLGKAVYGLCEIYRKEIEHADIIANPGCYPTATLLPLIPLLKRGLIRGGIVVNALSGISGAGKKTTENLLFCERTENAGAYSPGRSHRHVTEIESQIARFSAQSSLLFTPHLVPIKRGMAVTTVASLAPGADSGDILEAYRQEYEGSPFVSVLSESVPQTRSVWGSNRCDIGFRIEGSSILLFSVIDNLVKGASGQAVQNMNIRFRLREERGLRTFGEL